VQLNTGWIATDIYYYSDPDKQETEIRHMRDGHLQDVLGGYAKFLQDKNLALDKQQPYLVRWVREFLLFARAHAGYSFDQTLDLFLSEAGGRVGTKP